MLLPSLLLLACAPSLDPGDKDDTASQSEVQPGEAVVDATSESNWAFLDLEAAAIVTVDDPATSLAWDMGFRRYKVMLNGGASGSGGMEVVPLPGVDYNDPIELPTEGWITDQPDADGDGDLEYAFDSWFDYDSATHGVTAADVVFVVRTVEESYYKLQFLSYYDDAGSSGYIHLHWGPLDDTWVPDTGDTGDTGEPTGPTCTSDTSRSTTTEAGGVYTTTASTGGEADHVCYDLGTATQVEADWDLAMQQWTFLTPMEVAALPAEDFDALTAAPDTGYVTDDGTGSAFADWYQYNPATFQLEPADVVFVGHVPGGAYYKIQFLGYYEGGDPEKPDHPSFRWAEVAAPGA